MADELNDRFVCGLNDKQKMVVWDEGEPSPIQDVAVTNSLSVGNQNGNEG